MCVGPVDHAGDARVLDEDVLRADVHVDDGRVERLPLVLLGQLRGVSLLVQLEQR